MTADQLAVNSRALIAAAAKLEHAGYDGLPEKLRRRIVIEAGTSCWLWQGARSSAGGYGDVRMGGKYGPIRKVHRITYELLVGPIPEGLELDHLCRVRLCCNPEHLEAVTHRENVLRGASPIAAQVNVTHCPKGHPYSGDNLRINRQGARCCRACARALQQARNVRKAA